MRLRILQRYLLQRWAVPLAGAILFYGGMVLASQLVQFSRDIFDQGGALRWLFPLLLTSLPETLGMVLPMAAVLGGLLGTQHLAEGSELVASQGLGTGSRVIVTPWAFLGGLLILVGSFNAHILVPSSSRLQFRLQNQMLEEAQTRFLRPGAPPYTPPGSPNLALWVASNGSVHVMETGAEGVQHLVAQHMSWTRMEDRVQGPSLSLHLTDLRGVRIPKDGSHPIHIQQERLVLAQTVPPHFRPLPPTPVRYLDTPELIRGWSREAALELARRLALPVASAALLLLGIALGFAHPRFHHGGALVKSLLVILLYYLGLKIFENALSNGHGWGFVALILLPWAFMGAGWGALRLRLRPHHSHRFFHRLRWMRAWFFPFMDACRRLGIRCLILGKQRFQTVHRNRADRVSRGDILGAWSRRTWWRFWGGTLATFLLLNFLIEYASRAGDLSKNHIHFLVFMKFWILNLSNFLGIVLPIVFVFASVLAIGEWTVAREWTALKAGGVSLLQLGRRVGRALLLVLLGTLLFQAVLAPRMTGPAYALHRIMRRKEVPKGPSKPWLYLGSTGILWHLGPKERWGFPLQAPETSLALIHWPLRDRETRALAWDGLDFEPGPSPSRLFPEKALRAYARAEDVPTLDLFRWQRWAPDAERATLLWTRLLGWLAGPALLLAVLPFAFPAPRAGRGQALGYALVICLLYLGTQAIFQGAARAGELPAIFGVVAPMTLCVSVGLWNLHRIRT